MPDHDHDLIAALAEGRLEPDRAAEAERVIAADPAASALLAAHRKALAAIATAPAVELSATERSSLRAAVSDAVGLDRSPQPVVRRRAPWAAISVAAATLAALIAVVPLTRLLSDSSDTAAITVGIPETDDAARSTAEVGGAPAPADLGTAAAESDGTVEPVSTTAVAGAPTGQESPTLEERLVTLIAEPDELNDERLSPTADTACGSEAEEQIGTPLGELMFTELTVDDRPAMVFFTVVEGKPEMAAAFSVDGCELLESLP